MVMIKDPHPGKISKREWKKWYVEERKGFKNQAGDSSSITLKGGDRYRYIEIGR